MNELSNSDPIMKLQYLFYAVLFLLTNSCEQPSPIELPPSEEWTIEELLADLSKTVDEIIDEEIHVGRLEALTTTKPIAPVLGEDEDDHIIIQLQTIYARIGRVIEGDNREAFMHLIRRMDRRKALGIVQSLPVDRRLAVLRVHEQQSDRSWEIHTQCAQEVLPEDGNECMLAYAREVIHSLAQFTEQTSIPSYPF